ncbi:MAG TPA: bifunctional (p)ppGpp synthetase/guanosine-3',5'-bis(diphosphate) 3'-pyrophosphohydrolase [Rhizomicrobium sp.]|nr:bifunctional (p)ppGpp synthetase/guanosine-3',5'-bis(diphosphate) 3'-pyrophosphohydrolase [Rhizomicrobium sp.]
MTAPLNGLAETVRELAQAVTRPRRRKLMRQTELVERIKAYDPDADEALLNKAYVYAMTAHGKQFRASGDPYFAHPLEVAGILTELKLDPPTIVTALLHDTVEDTYVTIEDVKANFGEEIANLVDGVTKLSQLELFSERTKQAENFRKLMLAMSNDIRVLLVKLADRLHNMRTLQYIKNPEKRRRIAQETSEIYAPLAGRIGMQAMREELEDLAFAELDTEARNSIVTRLARLDAQSGERIGRIADQIKRKLAEHGIEAWVYGRAKRPYSIWRKLKDKQLNFEQLSDIFGFRVIVKTTDDCYLALGVLHMNWRVVPERFKDFISNPKTNGYRSIHTTVIGPEQQRVEVQIRTQEMHDIAERGVAAHWRYREHVDEKESGTDAAYEWLRDMVDILERGDSAEEFLEHSRLHMYQDQVFCFTPKGMLISLPRGATPIDFAYMVHTDLGHQTVGAKVNGVHVPLHTPLKNGDQVEIIRQKGQTPSPLWEQFVVTGRARAEIRRYLRNAQRDEHVKFGRKVLEKIFADDNQQLTDRAVEDVAKKLRLAKVEDVYAEVGRGALRAHEVLEAVFPEMKRDRTRTAVPASKEKAISISGLTEGIAYTLGQCCHPLPGDRIVGLMVPGQGTVIHTVDCAELEKAQTSMADWIDVKWGAHAADGEHVGRLRLRVKNAPGSLAAVMAVIASNGGNIFNLSTISRNALFFEFHVDIEVRDVAHLQNILGALRVNAAVESVDRVREGSEA